MPRLTRQQCIEVAMCCRLGAAQSKQFAAEADTLLVRDIHLKSAEYREELAKLFDEAAKGR